MAHSVDRGKAALLATVPSPRGVPGAPVAEALLEFEAALAQADEGMSAWRSPETEGPWRECRRALDEARSRTERLRLEAPALDYEGLVAVLGDIMDPLTAFEDAGRALGGLR